MTAHPLHPHDHHEGSDVNTPMSPLPADHPIMVAWEAYKKTEEYANSKRWATQVAHTDGSMWAAFLTGYEARRKEAPANCQEVIEQRDQVSNLQTQVRGLIDERKDLEARLQTKRDEVHELRNRCHAAEGMRDLGVKDLDDARRERDAWQETAAQHCRNEQYYAGLLDKAGCWLGHEAFTSDDGITHPDPLRVKVPELVQKLAARVRLHEDEKRACLRDRDEAVAELGRLRLLIAQYERGPVGENPHIPKDYMRRLGHAIIRDAALGKLGCSTFPIDQRLQIADAITAALEAFDG